MEEAKVLQHRLIGPNIGVGLYGVSFGKNFLHKFMIELNGLDFLSELYNDILVV